MRAEQTADSSLSTTLGVSYRMDAQCKAVGAVKQAEQLWKLFYAFISLTPSDLSELAVQRTAASPPASSTTLVATLLTGNTDV